MSCGSSTTIGPIIDKLQLPRHYLTLARDSYDNCLAYLDEQLGDLFDDLQRRGVLDRTWVVITADHGEGLGEHDLFEHGESLYSTEIRVPLLILPPSGSQPGSVVRETGQPARPAGDDRRLGRPWDRGTVPGTLAGEAVAAIPRRRADQAAGDDRVHLRAPEPQSQRFASHGRSPGRLGPLISLAEGDFVYIRNEGDGTEELFDEREDPRELTNRAPERRMQTHPRSDSVSVSPG